MNWKAEAVEKLHRYDAMRQAAKNLPLEIRRLEEKAHAIRSARTDGTAVRGGGSRREDMLLNNIAERQELQWALEDTCLWLDNTERALKKLTKEEQLVLNRMLIFPEQGGVERLCGELGVESSSVYRRRDQALRKFTIALYGAVDS